MAAPPARNEISDDYPNPSNSVARTGFGRLWDYVTGLLGASGDPEDARVALGLGNLDNTSDLNKPVSTATATAISNASTADRNRANHTGLQTISTVSGLQTALDGKVDLSPGGTQNISGIVGVAGHRSRTGVAGAWGGNNYNFSWNGTNLVGFVDNTNLGFVQFSSDERVKKNVTPATMEDLIGLIDLIDPIWFEFADVGVFKADGKRHLGFSAQGLAAILAEFVNGDVTAVNEAGDPQPASPDLPAILASAVLEIKSLKARVSALEARP